MGSYLRKEYIYLTLLLLTIGVIAWQHYGMNTSFSFDLPSRHAYKTLTDSIHGGKSSALLTEQSGYPTLTCDIQLSVDFPFCTLIININQPGEEGVDRSQFDTLTLELDYASTQRDTLMVYLSNVEYFNNKKVHRSNLQAITPQQGRHSYTLRLDQFYLPSWWVFYFPEHNSTKTMFNHVRSIHLSTGDNREPRQITLTAISFKFEGKQIRTQNLYTFIIFFWLVIALIQLAFTVKNLHGRFRSFHLQATEFNKINSFLKLERDKFKNMAKKDELTGCLNRYGTREVLEKVVNDFLYHNTTAVLLLFDIDFFKKLNDTYGHDEGDLVLKNLTMLVGQHLRDSDHLIRWGGEEFVIICEKSSLKGALTLAEHLRKMIAKSKLSDKTNITASFGVSELTSPQVEDWFKQADQSLYQAKARGRNRVASPED